MEQISLIKILKFKDSNSYHSYKKYTALFDYIRKDRLDIVISKLNDIIVKVRSIPIRNKKKFPVACSIYLLKLLKTALKVSKSSNINLIYVSEIKGTKGRLLKRRLYRARGTSSLIRRQYTTIEFTFSKIHE